MRQDLAHIARQSNSLLQTYEESVNAQLEFVKNLLTGSIRSFPGHGTSVASPNQGCSSRSTTPRVLRPPTNSRSITICRTSCESFRSLFLFYLSSFLTPLVFSLFLSTKNVILTGNSAVEQMSAWHDNWSSMVLSQPCTECVCDCGQWNNSFGQTIPC